MSELNKWQALSMQDRAFLIREAVRNGITDIGSIRDTWEHRFDGLRDVVEKVNTSDKDFAKRLRQEGRASIPDWEDPRRIATHKLGVATDENGVHYIFPSVQNINSQLVDFTNPKTKGHGYEDVIASERGDTIQIGNTSRDFRNAIKFTEKYKKLGIYPEFSEPSHIFDGESNQSTEGPVDQNEIKRRQAWAESRFRDDVTSRAGAKGRFQVMENVKMDYMKAGGEDGDLYDPRYNEKVRDWVYSNLTKRKWINKENSTDSVKTGKALAAYNAGPTNIINRLNKAKTNGINIDTSFDWLTTEYMPEETVNYVNWILRNKPTGIHRNDSVYNLNKHKYNKNKK